eukprot:TRINITY_DN9247_c0_g1_i3.p1 TRINITY_DN9247_c0_g1~~TRINITY_DN9247_c0_g1_i3.p1  ORF type:complete len:229 (+),score=83.66 TRINITY_DN9247_c0_g1_i3:89-775(+)
MCIRDRGKTTTPLELVKLVENLLVPLKTMKDIEAGNPNTEAAVTLELEETLFRAVRAFYTACCYLVLGKHIEAISLIDHSRSLFEASWNRLNVRESSELAQFDRALFLRKAAELKCKAYIKLLESNSTAEVVVEDKFNKMSLEEGANPTIRSIYDFINSQNASDELKDRIFKLPLVPLPPDPKLMSCRPIFFDLGYSHLRYPTLSKKAAKQEEKKGGFLSRLNIFKKN